MRQIFFKTETIAMIFFLPRALLVYCLRHYKGDDKIKSFIWDLISPTKEGQDQTLLNHSGPLLFDVIQIHSTSVLSINQNHFGMKSYENHCCCATFLIKHILPSKNGMYESSSSCCTGTITITLY